MGARFNGSRQRKFSLEVGSRRVNDTSISRIFFFLEVPNYRGDAVVHNDLTRATEKFGRPLVGGYRLGVGHKCCKSSWNFSISMLLFV